VVVEREVGFSIGVRVDSGTVAGLDCYPEACVCADFTDELDEGLEQQSLRPSTRALHQPRRVLPPLGCVQARAEAFLGQEALDLLL